MAPVRCNHTCGERRPLLARCDIATASSTRRHGNIGSDKTVIKTWTTFVHGAAGARPPLPKRTKSWRCPSSEQQTLYLAVGTKVEASRQDSLLPDFEPIHPRCAGSSLGPHVFIPPPSESVVDLESQGGECWESDEEENGQTSRVRRFFRKPREALSSPKVRVYVLIITMMLILLGISVGRLMVLERRVHVHEEVHGQPSVQDCCVEIAGSLVSWD